MIYTEVELRRRKNPQKPNGHTKLTNRDLQQILEEMPLAQTRKEALKDELIEGILYYQQYYSDVVKNATKEGLQFALNRLQKENGFSPDTMKILKEKGIFTGTLIIKKLKNRAEVDRSTLEQKDKDIIKHNYFPILIPIPLDDEAEQIVELLRKVLEKLSSGSVIQLEPKRKSNLLQGLSQVGLRLDYNLSSKVHEHACTRELFSDIEHKINPESHGCDIFFKLGDTDSGTELKCRTIDLSNIESDIETIKLYIDIPTLKREIQEDWEKKIFKHGCFYIQIRNQKTMEIVRGYRISRWFYMAYLRAMWGNEDNRGRKLTVNFSYCCFCKHFHRLLDWEECSNGDVSKESKEKFNEWVTKRQDRNICQPPNPFRTRKNPENNPLWNPPAYYNQEELKSLPKQFWDPTP
ncbi:hypothetical protein BV898_03064 [Hypsibius exemplaris]|uniref:Uncharacterized protein n=1 Tax=Hypsibius exemplaris TaxID=2072580 RepID=A0A1W0X6A2_HYPEX|nr:hypothetical protein BV898_03064 [Hypsibius exemplaris]